MYRVIFIDFSCDTFYKSTCSTLLPVSQFPNTNKKVKICSSKQGGYDLNQVI